MLTRLLSLTLGSILASTAVAHTQTSTPAMRLCGRTGVVHEGKLDDGRTFHETWVWDVAKAKGVPAEFVPRLQQIDDCKSSADGREMLISSSKGAVAIVGYPGGDARFWAAVPNAHSIDLMPDGLVAAASSSSKDGNMLMIFDRRVPDNPLWTMPMEAAHGVVWDAQRGVLWALRHKELLKLSVKRAGNGVQVDVLKTYAWGGAGGHDLLLIDGNRKLVCTTSSKVLLFDISAETFSRFQPLAGLTNVKSVAWDEVSQTMAFTQAESGEHWWTSVVHVRPAAAADIAVPLPFEVYKVRWVISK